jgi:ABC-2 type transport system permease protein
MIFGLWRKTWREIWLATLLCGLGLLLFEGLLAYVGWTFRDQLSGSLLKLSFVQNMISSLVGGSIGGELSLDAMGAIAWSHPLFLALLFAHGITIATRFPAGEIDRGTIDSFLSLPVRRRDVFLVETAAWLASGAALMLFAAAGSWIGNCFVPAEARPSPKNVAIVLANAWSLYAAVASMSLMISALSERRGKAVGLAFALVLVSFLLSVLAQFWKPAQSLAFLSFLSYHKPLLAFRDGAWPVANIAILWGSALVFSAIALIALVRRSLASV